MTTIFDRISLAIAVLILICPIFAYSWLKITYEHKTRRVWLEGVTNNALSDFEIFLDHLNGALITLQSDYQQCDDDYVNQMHRLSFDLAGAEAFAIVDRSHRILCSNWLKNIHRFPVTLPDPQTTGLQITGEEAIQEIQKTGIIAYRQGGEFIVAAIISSSYLRQLLTSSIPTGDSLVFYNKTLHEMLAINGLLPVDSKGMIDRWLLHTKASITQTDDSMFVQESEHFKSVLSAYFYNQKTWYVILKAHWYEMAIFFLFSIGTTWAWFWHRHQKIHSSTYQIKTGLKNQEFIAYLQPIVDMRNNQWIGAECLSRWIRNGHTVETPDVFIAAAEEASLIKEITIQVCYKLGQDIQNKSTQLNDFYFSFNLSPNFIDDNTVKSIARFRDIYRLFNAKNIRFEITERGLSDINKETFSQVIAKLRQEGYLFGLDDFGTGQSGLEYFSNINPDFLKLDRRFVNAIDTPESVDFQLLKTIVQLADSLQLIVIAEGVETKPQREWLVDHGIFYGQGWLFQKAIPINEFLERIIDNEFQQESKKQS